MSIHHDFIVDLAEAGYNAYGKSTGGLNYLGLPMPVWKDLPEKIKAAWIAATVEITDGAEEYWGIGH